MTPGPSYDVVVPTIGRPSLARLLEALDGMHGPAPRRIILVDDRPGPQPPLAEGPARPPEVLAGPAAGPAAARNVGWRAATAEWVAFLDDDVVPDPDWAERLAADLAGAGPEVAGVQGRLRVPLPADRRPTDWERNVAALATARWATADMAYRRDALAAVDGFDERFPRAFREDADLALRMVRAGWLLTVGQRTAAHPVRPAGPWVSVGLQAGNADDALMAALHGHGWHDAAGAPRGRITRHLATTAAGVGAVAARVAGRRRLAAAAGVAWLAATAELAWARILPGPRTPAEIATMTATSAVLPAVAAWHRLAGAVRYRVSGTAKRHPSAPCLTQKRLPGAVLFDRDGTLVVDVPYNGDPGRVVPAPGARAALDRLRDAGVPVAVVSNQSGVARGLLTPEQVDAVNRRIEELLGPLGPWLVCPHGPGEGCACRKPAAGLVEAAAAALGVPPSRCAVVGDIGADMDAARAAGARGVLVPTDATRPEEVAAAAEVATDLPTAVGLLLEGSG